MVEEDADVEALAYDVVDRWLNGDGARARCDLRKTLVDTVVNGYVVAVAEIETETEVVI